MGPNRKMVTTVLSYIYYLDEKHIEHIKTYCQDYTQKYASFTLSGIGGT